MADNLAGEEELFSPSGRLCEQPHHVRRGCSDRPRDCTLRETLALEHRDPTVWDYAVRRGWEATVHVVTGLDELLRLMRGGKVEVVLANSLVGLGHSVSDLVRALREFVSGRVVLIIPSAGIDTFKMGKVFPELADTVADFNRCVAEEAIKEGLRASAFLPGKLAGEGTLWGF